MEIENINFKLCSSYPKCIDPNIFGMKNNITTQIFICNKTEAENIIYFTNNKEMYLLALDNNNILSIGKYKDYDFNTSLVSFYPHLSYTDIIDKIRYSNLKVILIMLKCEYNDLVLPSLDDIYDIRPVRFAVKEKIIHCFLLLDEDNNIYNLKNLLSDTEQIFEKNNKDNISKDHISWDEYFMGIAKLSASRSKDPVTKVGACIINDDRKILSTGYNGFPNGCSDDEYPWSKGPDKDELDTKYPYVVHAELNAILNANKDIRGSTLYVTLFPCNECAKAIIQSGIKKVIYLEEKGKDKKEYIASRRMLNSAGIIYEKYNK